MIGTEGVAQNLVAGLAPLVPVVVVVLLFIVLLRKGVRALVVLLVAGTVIYDVSRDPAAILGAVVEWFRTDVVGG